MRGLSGVALCALQHLWISMVCINLVRLLPILYGSVINLHNVIPIHTSSVGLCEGAVFLCGLLLIVV